LKFSWSLAVVLVDLMVVVVDVAVVVQVDCYLDHLT
jgi:hypothetical protein